MPQRNAFALPSTTVPPAHSMAVLSSTVYGSVPHLANAPVRPATNRAPAGRIVVTAQPLGNVGPRPTLRPAQTPQPLSAADMTQSILLWAQSRGLCSHRADGTFTAQPWLQCSSDVEAMACHRDDLLSAHPALTVACADTVVAFMVQRARAEHADALATQTALATALRRVLTRQWQGQAYGRVARPQQAPHLLALSAPHYDGCLFDPQRMLGNGAQGNVAVGITKYGHPVAIKSIRADAQPQAADGRQALYRRATLRREAQEIQAAGQYDCLHAYSGPEVDYVVMPLFSGDLRRLAEPFLRLVYPPAPSPIAGEPGLAKPLRGARYLLAELLQEVASLHDDGLRVHQDIKTDNIFLQRHTERFLLGDFGLCAPMDYNGRAIMRGCTRQFAAPEQVALDFDRPPVGGLFGQAGALAPKLPTVDARADVYAVGSTLYHLLLTQCPSVVQWRQSHYPTATGDTLLPEGATNNAAWRQLHVAHRDYLAAVDDQAGYGWVHHDAPPFSSAHAGQIAHFDSVHRSIAACDLPLANFLRLLVSYDASDRPSAAEALATMERRDLAHGLSPEVLSHVWKSQIPRFDPRGQAQIERLRAAQATLRTADAPQA